MILGGVLVAFQNCGQFQSVLKTTGDALPASAGENSVRLTSDDELLINALSEGHDSLAELWTAMGIPPAQLDALNGTALLQGTLSLSEISTVHTMIEGALVIAAPALVGVPEADRAAALVIVKQFTTRLNQINRPGLSAEGVALLVANLDLLLKMREALEAAGVPTSSPSPSPSPMPSGTPEAGSTPVATPAPGSGGDAVFVTTLQMSSSTMRPHLKSFGLSDADAAVLCGDTLKNGTITATSIATAQANALRNIQAAAPFIGSRLNQIEIEASIADVDSGISKIGNQSPATLSPLAAQLREADLSVLRIAKAALESARK